MRSCGKIAPTRTWWMLAITGLLIQTAMAENGFAQTSGLMSQPNSWWQAAALRPAQQTNGWHYPTTQPDAPPSWPVKYSYDRGDAQPTKAWHYPATQPSAPPAWPVSDNYAHAQPSNPFHHPARQSYTLQSWPASYNSAAMATPPTITWQFPAPGTSSAPPTLPVNYSLFVPPPSPGEAPTPERESAAPANGGPFISTRTFTFWNDDLMIEGEVEIPVLGRMNVAEHNSPLPRDRAYFIYKNYNNVINNTIRDFSGNVLGQSDRGINQYLVGYERTFHDERSSLELRMPFFSTGSSQFNAGVSSNDPSIGNFALIAKRLVYRDDLTAVSAGCAVTMPTGDDTMFSIGGQTFNIQNDTAHFVPFLGMMKQSPDQCWFVMGFGGLDIPMRGNQIEFVDPIDGAQNLGRLTDQTLLYLDLTVGRWLYRNPCSNTLTGFAVQGELHYAGTLNDANSLQGTVSGVGWNTGFNFGNTQNRFDNTFAALVLHTELQNKTDIRVAGVFPMSDANNRFFDSEIFVSIIERF